MGKTWTEQEELRLFDLYDKYKDDEGRFHEYKVRDDERIGGRTKRALSARLEVNYNIKTLSRDPNGWSKVNAKVIELYKAGLSYRQIAKDAGCSEGHCRNQVRDYLDRNPNEAEPKRTITKFTTWTPEEERHVLDTANKYLNPADGTVRWKIIPGEYIIRSRSAMTVRFNESIRPDCTFDVKRKIWFCPRLAEVPRSSLLVSQENEQSSEDTSTKKEFVTIRKTFLWGAYKHETIRYE